MQHAIHGENKITHMLRRIGESKASPSTIHIMASNNRWVVKRDGRMRASATLTSKSRALARANEIPNAKTIIVHSKDGSVNKIFNVTATIKIGLANSARATKTHLAKENGHANTKSHVSSTVFKKITMNPHK